MSDSDLRDDDIGRLIRSAGRGPSPSPEARARIYSATNAAWRRAVAERRSSRRRRVWRAAAAGVVATVATALVVNLGGETGPQNPPGLATVARGDGPAALVCAGGQRRGGPGADVRRQGSG